MEPPSGDQRDAKNLEILQNMSLHLSAWNERCRIVEWPEIGSDLHEDNESMEGEFVPLSELARSGLASSSEHMRMAMLAVQVGNLFPRAHPSLIRAALLNAAQAVWILYEDSAPVRRKRAISLELETFRRYAEWIEGRGEFLPGSHEHGVKTEVDQWVNKLKDQQGSEPLRSSATRVIRDVGRAVLGDEARAESLVSMWRQLSGDAHGLIWPILTRQSVVEVQGSPGDQESPQPAAVTSWGSLADLMGPFQATFEILRTGWSLYDSRSKMA